MYEFGIGDDPPMSETLYMDTRSTALGTPTISFVVPVYNTRDYLAETLQSISADGQDGVELIIVNDGSTDDSLAVIEDWVRMSGYPTLVLTQPNSGLSAARMAGIRHCSGQFIGFCDSDDRVEISAYRYLYRFATERDCDVVLCRAVIVDDLTHCIADFYDAHKWDAILAGKSSLVTTLAREPRLARLEPHAGTRLLRRSFVTEAGISFPHGLYFEDLPPHIAALSQAIRVGLVDTTGYFYRINRAGTITSDKSAKRFDMITIAEQAFTLTESLQIGDLAWANVLALVVRMLYWCGTNTLNRDRQLFFSNAAALIRDKVPARVVNECINNWTDDREAAIVSAMAANAVAVLCARASLERMPITAFVTFLINRRYGRVPRRIVARILAARAHQVSLRLARALW